MTNEIEVVQVPATCTLPTTERPLRLAEFRDMLALVRAVERPAPTRLLLTLSPAPGRVEAVRDLAARESQCCSFFDFTVREDDDGLLLQVIVPPAHVGVLDAMAEQAIGTAGRSSAAADCAAI